VRAHKTDDWGPIDRMVTRKVIDRIEAGSECIVASFFGIDEYSHLYDPFDERTVGAYLKIDDSVGRIVEALKREGQYDNTLLAVVSDHGLSSTKVHIPVVDIVKAHGFNPFYYPRLYRKENDCAVMESGNSMAQIYFRRGQRWGAHWTYEELAADPRVGGLIDALVETEGMSFVAARAGGNGVVFVGLEGKLTATRNDGWIEVSVEGKNPLPEHPAGRFRPRDLFEKTFPHKFPDAVNQVLMLFNSERSGDLALSSELSYDLRLQHEDPEHHGSHGSLHRDHMHVPLAFSVPYENEFVYNYDLVPTILTLTGKANSRQFDGRPLAVTNGHAVKTAMAEVEQPDESKKGRWLPIAITVGIILIGMILTAIFQEDLFSYGKLIMEKYGQDKVDILLFLITAVSSSPLALPIWGWVLVGVAMGYPVWRLALVMALGSATGSLITFLLGRYFGDSAWVRRKFPKLRQHPWTTGRSRFVVTLILIGGTASPIPCDVFYAACGLKKYPPVLFWFSMVLARFIRYIYMGYGFDLFRDLW